MVFKRARQPEQKEQRRADLLKAAADLVATQSLDKISLGAVAKKAGICKSNVYRYFDSLEDIYLGLLMQDQQQWINDLERRLAALGSSNNVDAVADILAASVGAHPRMAELNASLSSVLERNISERSVVDFKIEVHALMRRLVNALHAAVPALSVESCMRFVKYMHFFVVGLWPAANPAPALAAVYKRPEFASLCIELEHELKHGLSVMLRGLLAEIKS